MYAYDTRLAALDLRAAGLSYREIANRLGMSRFTVRDWAADPGQALAIQERSKGHCFVCRSEPCPEPASYAYVLAQYLGDGHLATSARVPVLRIAACLDYPEIAYEMLLRINRLRRAPPSFVAISNSDRLTNVQSYWMHWPCLLPQHGPGPKHRRDVSLTDWQQRIVDDQPWQLIRGLLHSDGCRCINKVVISGKSYSYPRWFFSNESRDILEIMGSTLDAVGVEWRYNRPNSISIARRASVALLDEHVGPKT